MSFSWTGRQLDSITKSDGTVVSFTYDANGMRTEKTVGDETYSYVWQNGKLIAETYVNGTDSRSIYYIYDENGSPIAWSYLDEYYYYIKNQQGDILGFTDSEGNVVVTYEYDAWGNLLSYTGTSYLAEYNSLRYRGYAYDVETGLYYLQSRYYDPKVGRFLNADDTDYLGASGTVLGYNLYAYCENNIVNFADYTGEIFVTATALGAAIALFKTAVAFLAAVVTVYIIAIIVTSPGFKRFANALSTAINVVGAGIKTFVISLIQEVAKAFQKAKARTANKKYEGHHIVAKAAKAAEPARKILAKHGIDKNSPVNMIWIKYNLHRHLHTTAYYNCVNKIIEKAKSSKAKVLNALEMIGACLEMFSVITP